MQHTDILELNACIAFLRPGRGGGATGLDKYDMTHTFVDGRDHHLTALFANSPPPDESALAWVATPQEIKQDQQRRQKEREMEDLRKSMRKQQPQQQQQQQQQQAPVELALTSPKPLAVLTFERKFVVGGGGEKKSALTQDLTRAKLDGGVVTGDSNNSGSSSRANAPTNGPSVKLIIFLPDRTPLEIRVSKTATVEHAIVAVLERTLIQGKRRKNYKGFEMRMHDEDGIPDEDFPALDASQNIAEIGAGEYCLVDLGIPELPMVATTSPSPVVLTPAVLPSSQRKQSLSKAGVIHVVFVDIEHHDQHGSSQKVDLLDSRASQFLKKVVKAVQLPLIADEYQFHVTEQDRDRLQVVSTVVHPNDDVLALGVEMLLLRKRRYADAPPDLDVSALGGNNKLPATPERITATPLAQPLPQLLPVYKHSTIKPPVVSTTTTTTTAATTTATTTTVAATTGLSKKLTTVSVASANAITMPTSAQLQVKHSFAGGVDPNTILLNEIKAAVYEEWKVTKTNNWGKRQARILGIDLTKIYNKTQSTTSGGGGGGGGRVKNAERLIADVVSIELNTANAAAFTIKVKDTGISGGLVTLNYEAEDGADDAARIVAKVKYIMGSRAAARRT